jgi:hypothetical protein
VVLHFAFKYFTDSIATRIFKIVHTGNIYTAPEFKQIIFKPRPKLGFFLGYSNYITRPTWQMALKQGTNLWTARKAGYKNQTSSTLEKH